MNDTVGPLLIERTWNITDGQQGWRIAWTAEQLRRIGQAVEEGDQAFLTMIARAMCQALDEALTPLQG